MQNVWMRIMRPFVTGFVHRGGPLAICLVLVMVCLTLFAKWHRGAPIF